MLPNYGSIRGVVGKEPETGRTAKTVAENVKRLRTDQNLNYTQLSERLQDTAGWSINAVGIRRVEAGERRVTPDDLMALAVALDVSPVTLLMPYTDAPDVAVESTGLGEPRRAETLWKWLVVDEPLDEAEINEVFAFRGRSLPRWEAAKQIKALARYVQGKHLLDQSALGGERAEQASQRLDELLKEWDDGQS
jgi:transcriptional regulator with XRE-family HTH domain